MAARKRTESLSLGLSLPAPVAEPERSPPSVPPPMRSEPADLGRANLDSDQSQSSGLPVPPICGTPRPDEAPADLSDVDAFDDYDDEAIVDEAPRIRLVDPPREVTIIVECVGSGPKGDTFEVSRLRHCGTSYACVSWTRKELIELAGRIAAALEI